MKIIILDKVDSTNDYVKRYVKKGEDVAVIAKSQTKGRGTKGRSFSSLPGGVYISVLKFYDGLKADRAYSIVSDTAVAVVNTLRAFGLEASIKWPNDVFCNGKKICGILTESTFSGDEVVYSVTGIGINVNNDLPPELKDIAVSAKEILGAELNLESVTATLVYNLGRPDNEGLYARYSCVLGKKIRVFLPDGSEFDAVAKDVLPDGRLVLDDGRVLTAAEIKLI